MRTNRVFVYLVLLVLMISGCGYRPSSHYTNMVLGDKIYSQIIIDINDPENSVLIKDALNEAIISKFRSKIEFKRELSESQIYIKFNSINFLPISYNRDGYITAYKAKVSLKIRYIDKFGKKGSFGVKGSYDFTIEPNSVISDSKRFEAIKFASYKAISEFVSKISIIGVRSVNQNK